MKRLFAAVKIHPTDNFISTYDDLRKGLRFADIKWVPPENIHVTLKFFGETDEEGIPDINQVLGIVAKDHQPFTLDLKDVGIFGSSYAPRVIWFGMDRAEPLVKLANHVLKEVETIGWERDRQNFVAHLTVGRVNFVPDKRLFQKVIDDLKDIYIQPVQVKEIHLYESILRKEGPLYKVIKTFALG